MKTDNQVKTDLKITIHQLKNYLGTGLMVFIDQDSVDQERLTGIFDEAEEVQTNVELAPFEDVRPICYRLSDLDKFIPELGFVPLNELTPYANTRFTFVRDIGEDLRDWTFQDMQKLFQWHFWPFGDQYFEAGLVIDKLKQDK